MKDRHKTFCLAYLETYNASEAARQAGYKESHAVKIGWELTQRAEIKRYIRNKLNDIWEDKLEIVRARVFQLWIDIAFGDKVEEGETLQDKIARKAMQLKASELLAKYFPPSRPMDSDNDPDGDGYKIVRIIAKRPDERNPILPATEAE